MNRILGAMLSLGVLALASPAAAQTTDTVSGVVVSSSADSLVIRLDDGSQRTFVTDTTSTLPSGRLAEDSRVTVRFGPMDGGRSRAVNVVLAAGAPTQRPADRPITQEPMREDSTTDRSARELPDTASGMPLQLLAGLAALAGALLLRRVSRRAA
jgi:LPXTG-motif cell wall-anchored protein